MRFNMIEKIVQHLDASLRLFKVRHVRAVLEDDPFGAGDTAMHQLGNGRCRLVVATAHDQGFIPVERDKSLFG